MITPNRILIEVAVATAVFIGGYFYGGIAEGDRRDAAALHEMIGQREALEAVAVELAKVKVINKSTTNILEKEVVTEVRYRDVTNTPKVVDVLNSALEGKHAVLEDVQ